MAVFYRYQDSGLDDWEKEKNYVQMGFRPGFSVQARELTQMQTAMQSQITALAHSQGLKSGSIVDRSSLSVNGPGTPGIWNLSLNRGDIFCEPDLRELGYFVHNNTPQSLSGINVPTGERLNIYVRWMEIQVNADGDPIPAQGGYVEVRVDGSILDNAQGYANSSAPGASRYKIDIVSLGSYNPATESKPVHSADMIYFQNGTPYYSDDGTAVAYNQ